jgi:hypothetical protein
MGRPLFLHIMNAVEKHDNYFMQKRNVAHKLGLSCLQKITAAFHMLCNGVATDTTDEYVCKSASRTSCRFCCLNDKMIKELISFIKCET